MSTAAAKTSNVKQPMVGSKTIHHGSPGELDLEAPIYTFVCIKREPHFYITVDNIIKFRNYTYSTNSEEEAEFLRGLKSLFGTDIFENDFPEDIKKKRQKEREEMTAQREDGGE